MGGGRVVEVKNHNELQQLLKDAGNNLVVVDFSAKWCGPCRMIAPYYAELSDKPEYKDITFAKVDVDEVEEAAQAYTVEAMPTFLFIKNGKEVDGLERLTGASKDRLLSSINQAKDK